MSIHFVVTLKSFWDNLYWSLQSIIVQLKDTQNSKRQHIIGNLLHEEQQEGPDQTCDLCKDNGQRETYGDQFKEVHSSVRLGCP